MTVKCLVFILWLQLFLELMLWNLIKCDCPFPEEKIINGEYIYESDIDKELFSAKERYILFIRCNAGYELIGANGIQCLDGKWSGEVPSCKDVTAMECGTPPSISNGTYILTANDKITIRSEAIYSCNSGYELSDPLASRLTCILNEDEDGTLWAGYIPACQAMQCDVPPSIANGFYIANVNENIEITIGTQANYSCKSGYELSEPLVSKLTCNLNGNGDEALWTGDIPVCQAIEPCSDPGVSINGARIGDCCLPGNIVSYSCNEGFEMVGEKDIECLSSRLWSSPRPLCRPLENHCELPPKIPNGLVVMKSGDYALPGEVGDILCKTGYKFNGPNQHPYCSESALWEDISGECEEITCDRPEPLANGDIPELEKSDSNATFPNNFLLTYDCNEGYRLKGGEPCRACTKDGWSGTVPYCEGTDDFDSIEEIGRNYKHKLNLKFDEEIGDYKMLLSAPGLSGQDGRILENPPDGRLIMYFAFDVSGSIGRVNFVKSIEFAKAIVREIWVSEHGARVGAFIFSSESNNMFFPMDYQNTEDVINQLDNIEYTGGGTSVTSALELMIANVQLQEAQTIFDQKNTKTVLFLMTDGKITTGGMPENLAETLKDKMKVEIYCIGITSDVRVDILSRLASVSKHNNEGRVNVFILKNYEYLKWLIQDITIGKIDYSQCGLGLEQLIGNTKMDTETLTTGKSLQHWPWMVTLFLKVDKAKPRLICGGSIINEHFILTAASCLFEHTTKKLEYRKRSKEEIIVKAGLLDMEDDRFLQEFQVETIYTHDNYSLGRFFDNYIALLKLNRPIMYHAYVRPVCLPPAVLPENDNNPFYKPDEYGWVTGFGHEGRVLPYERNENYKMSKLLKEYRLPIQPKTACSSSLRKINYNFSERIFCAGDGSGNGPCHGDVGGPFMQHHLNSKGEFYWTQVGIFSWSFGCGNRGRNGYYTNVQRFRPWINDKIKDIVSSQRKKCGWYLY